MAVRDSIWRVLSLFPAALARAGLVNREQAESAFDLAVPVMVTGGLRVLLRIADFLMVGLALGDAAIAGLELGFQYYFIGFGLSLAVSSGTISVVSRLQGADRPERANLAVKQSLWLALVVSVPLTVGAWVYAEPLVGILTADPAAVDYGATYLSIVMLSMAPRFFSMVAARALAGSADTRTPMYARLLTLPMNVVLNAVLIFGLGPIPSFGIAGAAIGTVAANALAGALFFWLLVSGEYAVTLDLGGRQLDLGLVVEILRVGLPLAGMRLVQTLARFPFLFILGVLGTPALAAYAIARRVMLLALMPAWGYSTAASTLVGQHIGAGDDDLAAAYGWQTLRIALATQLLIGAVIVVAARPIAVAFGTDHVGLTVSFIRLFGVVVAGFSISRTMRGGLRGAGDTRWPLYAMIAGSFLVRLPIAALALPAGFAVTLLGVSLPVGLGLGFPAIYVAIVADFYVKAAVNTGRFRSGRWRGVARASGLGGD
ncbi:MATE family efflux transporter [Halobellus rubicundus]|uniref:Multidrug-efflux transporter n=1 Tax=Halobellus rubicundus TaxID=2996466 RepID=A0ABD5M9W1_9EURY